jgi:thioesterase domain-containing protein
MLPGDLEAYLHAQIPLSRLMGVRVCEVVYGSVLLDAPLLPNINHHETAFGGSVSALAILASWALIHTRLKADNVAVNLVIQRSTINYERPITGPFAARSKLTSPLLWGPFRSMLARKGKARIEVTTLVQCNGDVKAMFYGTFVALREVEPPVPASIMVQNSAVR